MVNYSNGKIYKIEPICDHEEGDIYIGSTTKKYLADRMCDHRADFKRKEKTKINSFILFEKYGVENCKIHLLVLYPCNTKDELLAKEAEYIRTFKCVNKVIPDRTKQEYDKEYRIKMKDNYLKEYNELFKDKIKERRHLHYINNKEKKQQQEK